jgi:hypothetical protein
MKANIKCFKSLQKAYFKKESIRFKIINCAL